MRGDDKLALFRRCDDVEGYAGEGQAGMLGGENIGSTMVLMSG